MAWFDEFKLPGATIDGRFGYIRADGPDDDEYPDVVLAEGWVTFTATTPAARVDGAWLGIEPVTAKIYGGQIVTAEEDPRPVRLLATDAPIGVADWAWRASFNVPGFRLNELTFRAPRDTTVNLTADLIPIKSQPYQIIEGASIVDTEVDAAGERMRFKMSDGTFTDWVNVPNGEPGAKGDKGDKGDPGADGQSPTIAMGSVSAGANADAWMTGTPLARELNLTLPRGVKGDKGDTPTWGDLPGKPTSFPTTIPDVQGLVARLAELEYDSGTRDMSTVAPGMTDGSWTLRRVGKVVYMALYSTRFTPTNGTVWQASGMIPAGFRPPPVPNYIFLAPAVHSTASTATNGARVNRYGGVDIYDISGKTFSTVATWVTDDPVPTTLPGTPV